MGGVYELEKLAGTKRSLWTSAEGALHAKGLNHRGRRETAATEVRAKGAAEPYSAGPFGFARGRTPLLFQNLDDAES